MTEADRSGPAPDPREERPPGAPPADAFAGLDPDAPPLWETLARWRAEGRRFALVTVVETRGFTPRKAGVHMLVGAGGETAGTVGGGAIEQEVLREARDLLERGAGSTLLRRHLTQELGMCCGGEMTIHIESIELAPRLVIFGAGYIARPLAAIAAGCGFRVTVVDERPEWASAERFPNAERHCRPPDAATNDLGLCASDYVVVTTHDHALDQRVVQQLLKLPLRFIGMIGSVPKQRKFALRLRARGFGDADIARLHTPLGVSIGASSPEEIAVSVMAELIAVRRGAPIGWEWVPPVSRSEPVEEAGAEREEPARSPDQRRERPTVPRPGEVERR